MTSAMSKDYGLVNAWDSEGNWLGFFMDKKTAETWLTQNGHDLAKCEVSNRKHIRQTKTEDANG